MTTFEQLTVGQYQELYKISKLNIDDIDKETQFVGVITGKSDREVGEMTLPDYVKAKNTIIDIFERAKLTYDPQKTVKINGKRFGICYEPSKLSGGQYITIQHWMQGDVVENMHLIMASIVYPVKRFWYGLRSLPPVTEDHSKNAEGIKDLPFLAVWSACVFFCNLLNHSINNLQDFLMKSLLKKGMKRNQASSLLMGLQNSMAGYTTLNELPILKI